MKPTASTIERRIEALENRANPEQKHATVLRIICNGVAPEDYETTRRTLNGVVCETYMPRPGAQVMSDRVVIVPAKLTPEQWIEQAKEFQS